MTVEISLKQEMINEAKALNKYLTDEYLMGKTFKQLLGFTHPIYRERHIKNYENNGFSW